MRRMIMAFALAALSGGANATALSGTFNISGDMTVTSTAITWTSSTGVANEATISPAGLTGSFTGLGSTSVNLDAWNSATEPVGNTTFPAQAFLSFLSGSFPGLSINEVYAGVDGSTECSASPSVGQTCTPKGSMFNFQNSPPPPGLATLTFAFGGVTSDGKSKWFANFTSQFVEPYQSVLATSSFSNSYDASFTVTPMTSAVPEPATLSLFAAALAALATARRRRKTS